MSIEHDAAESNGGPTSSIPERLTIVLEPLRGSIFHNTVNALGTMGSGTRRFVAISDTGDRLEGPTFVAPRGPGGDQTPDPRWPPDMPAALADLQREVEHAGWRKVERGKQFWSWTYRR